MKAIILCENLETPFRIFRPNTIRELQEHLEIEPKAYTKADVLRDPAAFKEVRFVFSTWGMPVFTEEEIKACFPSLQCVFYGAGTVQKFARPFLACGVKVFSAWAANAVPTRLEEQSMAEWGRL